MRAYYDSMSLDPQDRAKGETRGKFQLHAHWINAADGDYPRWIQLPRIKAYYHEIDDNDPAMRLDGGMLGNIFWDEAYAAAWDSVRCWNPDPIPNVADPPMRCSTRIGFHGIS